MRRLDLHVPVLGASEATGSLEDQQVLLSASLSHVQDSANRLVSNSFHLPHRSSKLLVEGGHIHPSRAFQMNPHFMFQAAPPSCLCSDISHLVCH